LTLWFPTMADSMNCERTSNPYLNSRGCDMGMSEAIQLKLLDHMGSDLTVVNAARVSFKKRSVSGELWLHKEVAPPAGAVRVGVDHEDKDIIIWSVLSEKDKKLIRFLARHKHTTPFRHPHLQFWCKAPIFLARQLGKHQIGMSWNEVSRRYVSDEPKFYIPDCWRRRPEDGIKQGSSDECAERMRDARGTLIEQAYNDVLIKALNTYNDLIHADIAPEMARMVLPQSMITEWIWTGSLYAFFNVWRQRADAHAQKEARYFAELLDKAIPDDLRVSWETLKEYKP